MKQELPVLVSLFFWLGFSSIYSQAKSSKPDDISVSRNVSATRYNVEGEHVVIITLIINKNNSGGHAVLEDDFSSDLEATAINNDKGSFQSSTGKAIFEWKDIPRDKQVIISYQLKAISKAPDDQAVFGQFSFQNHVYTISPSSFSLKVVTGQQKPQPVLKNTAANPAPKPSNTAAVHETGNLVYRIQIAAIDNKAKAPELLKQYNISDEPYLEQAGTNIIRLMIGSYANFSGAKARVDELKSKGLTGAFVVPYYKGKRTNLQDAAMHVHE